MEVGRVAKLDLDNLFNRLLVAQIMEAAIRPVEGSTRRSPSPFPGGPAPTAAMSPAVAYAIQQGGVDNRALGTPAVFEPGGNVSFQDCSDHVITTCDSNMSGDYGRDREHSGQDPS